MGGFDRASLDHRLNRRVFGGVAAAGLLLGTRFGVAAQTPQALPVASPALATPAAVGQPGSLAALLAKVPDLFGSTGAQAASQMVTYGNVAGQLAAVQVQRPATTAGAGYPFIAALTGILLPDPLASYYLDPRWPTLFGFRQLDVDQSLQAGSPPDLVTLYRGRFNDAQIVAALTKSGYKPVAVGGLTAYSLRADASIDLTSPVGQIALALMNNGVRLPDGTWAFASTLNRIRSVVEVTQGRATSLAGRPDVQTALAAPGPELASAIMAPGTTLRVSVAAELLGPTASPQAIAQVQHELEQYGTLPPVGLVLLATTVGGPLPPPPGGGTPPAPAAPSIQPVAQAEITLVMATPAAAQTAVPIIEKRLAGMTSSLLNEPYSALFTRPVVAAVSGQPVVQLTLLPAHGRQPSVVFQMFEGRDLAFIAW